MSKKIKLEDVSKVGYFEDQESLEEIAKQYKRFHNAPKFNLNSEEVYCICRRPDHGGEMMISCDGCEEWFHFGCMKMNEKYAKLIAKFYCKFCRWKNGNKTTWKRKCRLNSCFEPIKADLNSKYCSKEHGMAFYEKHIIHRQRGLQDINISEIKSILNYVQDDSERLYSLGIKFPDLPQVVDFLKDAKETKTFPTPVRDSLSKLTSKINDLNSSIQSLEVKSQYLNELKNMIKTINEKASFVIQPDVSNDQNVKSSKKGKNKVKKVDLCCYDKIALKDDSPKVLKLIESNDIYETFRDEIDSIIQYIKHNESVESPNFWFNDSYCVQERKKCLRHKGWLSLQQDETSMSISELSKIVKSLENERLQILRNYSISIYENT